MLPGDDVELRDDLAHVPSLGLSVPRGAERVERAARLADAIAVDEAELVEELEAEVLIVLVASSAAIMLPVRLLEACQSFRFV